MRRNVVKEKSFEFAVAVVKKCTFLIEDRREYVMSKQLLRSGTSVGAMVREAEQAESKKDFIHKLAIALKEINESVYWLELMERTDYLSKEEFASLHGSAHELIKLLTSIIKTTKANLNR